MKKVWRRYTAANCQTSVSHYGHGPVFTGHFEQGCLRTGLIWGPECIVVKVELAASVATGFVVRTRIDPNPEIYVEAREPVKDQHLTLDRDRSILICQALCSRPLRLFSPLDQKLSKFE